MSSALGVSVVGETAPTPDFWTQILGGAIGSSPTAIVLWIMLSRAQSKIDEKDAQLAKQNEDAREHELEREREMRAREKELIARLAPLVYESSRAYEEGMRSFDRETVDQHNLEQVVGQLQDVVRRMGK